MPPADLATAEQNRQQRVFVDLAVSDGTTAIRSWRQGPALARGAAILGVQSDLPATRPDTPLESRPRPIFGKSGKAVSVYDFGAKGDGKTDDTNSIQAAIDASPEVFLPHGIYMISATIHLKSTTTLCGEAYSTLIPMPGASAWAEGSNSNPVAMIATPSDASASVQLMDLFFATAGDAPNCIMLDWQSGSASGVWDVFHQIMHPVWAQLRVSGHGGGYFENMWMWTADHSLDTGKEITVKSPRGMLIQNNTSPVWMYGVAAEHSSEYQYMLDGAHDVTMVTTQSETPYWQTPPSAVALTITRSTNVWSYGSAFECWFNGIERTLLEVTNSTNVYLYLPSTKNASYLLTGDRTVPASGPYAPKDHFTASFVADVPY